MPDYSVCPNRVRMRLIESSRETQGRVIEWSVWTFVFAGEGADALVQSTPNAHDSSSNARALAGRAGLASFGGPQIYRSLAPNLTDGPTNIAGHAERELAEAAGTSWAAPAPIRHPVIGGTRPRGTLVVEARELRIRAGSCSAGSTEQGAGRRGQYHGELDMGIGGEKRGRGLVTTESSQASGKRHEGRPPWGAYQRESNPARHAYTSPPPCHVAPASPQHWHQAKGQHPRRGSAQASTPRAPAAASATTTRKPFRDATATSGVRG